MADVVQAFLRDDRGLESIEHGIVAGIIVGGLVLVLSTIGAWVGFELAALRSELPGGASGPGGSEPAAAKGDAPRAGSSGGPGGGPSGGPGGPGAPKAKGP